MDQREYQKQMRGDAPDATTEVYYQISIFCQGCQVKDGMNATAAAINFDNYYCSSTLSECINNKQDIDAIKLCVLCSTKNKYSVSNSHFLLVL